MERHLTGQDLTACEFTGADLKRADLRETEAGGVSFRGADLRGADFSRACLAGADLRGARLGMRPLARGLVLLLGVCIAAIAGLAIGLIAREIRELTFSEGWENPTRGGAFMFLVVLFLVVLWAKGLKAASVVFLVGLGLFMVLGAVLYSAVSSYDVGVSLRLAALAIIVVVVFLVGLVGRMLGGTVSVVGMMAVAVVGGLVAGRSGGAIGALVVSLAMAMLAKRALRNDDRDRPIERAAHWLVRRWGTRFTEADLSGADLRDTMLILADMTGAQTEDLLR